MGNSEPNQTETELEQLRRALDGETQHCLEIQRQLDRANADFEEFVSMAAHNLRESLRDVASFNQLITETCGNRLDPDSVLFLDRVRMGAADMQALLADIVGYWAISPSDRHPVPTDMEAVLHQALLRTEKQIIERAAIITHDPLPEVSGDFEILIKVLHHLIRNAIEFCGLPIPYIHISSKQTDLRWVFSVRDNGPGIEPPFHQRIFEPFKRLHGKEYPGHGLGLAFCRKAIESHGGQIWIESATGTGSTFSFTLPPVDV